MTPFYDDITGDIIGYTDSYGNIYDANGQLTYQANMVPSGQAGTVSPSTPPASVIATGASTTDWAKLFTDAAPKIITGIQAWQLSQINVQRASQGLPPLNAALYAPGQAGFLANMSSTSMLLIAGIAAIFLMSGKRK